MGHREDLLEGAKRCLYEKGYAYYSTRHRCGLRHQPGPIGYHYGSTEALLQAAMIRAIEEWGEKLERASPLISIPRLHPWSDTR